MIDPATGWFEIVELPVVEKPLNEDGKMTCQETFDKTSDRIAQVVNKTWFSRYPRPVDVVFDNGSEFRLHFQHLLDTYSVRKKADHSQESTSKWNFRTCASNPW